MKLLTVKEASLKLNVKEKTLYEWVRQNKIPHSRFNGVVRFPEDKIEEWIENNTHAV